jgi:hypothetical protein
VNSHREPKKFQSFGEFWPFYLGEHSNPKTRTAHFIGTSSVILVLVFSLVSARYLLLLALPVVGYAPAWISHFFIEKNRPATFRYPLYSLMADFKLWALILFRKI